MKATSRHGFIGLSPEKYNGYSGQPMYEAEIGSSINLRNVSLNRAVMNIKKYQRLRPYGNKFHPFGQFATYKITWKVINNKLALNFYELNQTSILYWSAQITNYQPINYITLAGGNMHTRVAWKFYDGKLIL